MRQYIFETESNSRASAGGLARRAASARPAMFRNRALAAVRRAFRPLIRAHRRNAAIVELSALSDRQLRDIGLERERIPEVVGRAMRSDDSTT